MPTQLEMHRLCPKGRALFCLRLATALPPLPSEIQTKIGETNVALIDSALHALESAASEDGVNLAELTVGLSTIVAVAERRALEIEARDYRPGDNYGFSGAADTYSEVYRYLSSYMHTLAHAVSLDADKCATAFAGALKLYGIHSAHGDPKGAIFREIKEAEERSESIIAEAYRSIPEEWKNCEEEVVAAPRVEELDTTERVACVFISFKNLDAQGEQTRDCQIATNITRVLRQPLWTSVRYKAHFWKPVFVSLFLLKCLFLRKWLMIRSAILMGFEPVSRSRPFCDCLKASFPRGIAQKRQKKTMRCAQPLLIAQM